MRLTNRQLLLGGALVLAAAVLAAFSLRTGPLVIAQAVPSAADTLCAVEASAPERLAAARAAAQAGTLRGALEKAGCPAQALGAGLSQLAFVFDRDCAQDACLDLLLRDPSAPQAIDLMTAHAAQLVEALAARSCELGEPRIARLLQTVLGPSAPAVAAVGRGHLLDADREGLRSLLARREPLAARLLQAALRAQFCEGDEHGHRRELAGALLQAMGISVSEPVDVAAALAHVECAPLVELVPGLGLAEPPRLAEVAQWLSRCALLPRSLRARAAGFLAPRAVPEPVVRPARGTRVVDRRSKRALALDAEALAPGVALLDRKGLLRGLAFLTGDDAPVCGAPALRWMDERGRPRVLLDPSGLSFLDASGRLRAWLGAQRAELRSTSGEVVARAEAGADHGVQLEDAEGRVRARGVWRSEGTQLRLVDGDAVLASLIVDSRGAQLQLGGAVLDAIPDKAQCVSVGAPATAKSRFVLEGPLGARAALQLESAEVPLPALELADGLEAERLDSIDTGTLRLLKAGVRATHSGVEKTMAPDAGDDGGGAPDAAGAQPQ